MTAPGAADIGPTRPQPISPADRRRTGALILLVALLLAVVIPNIRTKQLAGTGSAAPPSPPPAVGDCAAEPLPDVYGAGDLPFLPSVAFGPCHDVNVGEVGAVLSGQVATGPEAGHDFSEMVTWCDRAVRRYFGIPEVAPGPAGVLWAPTVNYSLVMTGPDPRQRAAGQRWMACSVVGSRFDGGRIDERLVVPTTRNGWSRGTLPNSVGSCAVGPVSSGFESVACSKVHSVQWFTDTFMESGNPDDPGMSRSCAEVVKKLTGLPEITAGGRLAPTVSVARNGPDGSRSQRTGTLAIGESAQLGCSLTTTGHWSLTGSLLGIGSRPIPWGR